MTKHKIKRQRSSVLHSEARVGVEDREGGEELGPVVLIILRHLELLWPSNLNANVVKARRTPQA